MIRVSQQDCADGAKRYYATADYYSEGQEIVGAWGGKGAKRLGLSGTVDKLAFESLCDNRNPNTGTPLTARTRTERTVGYDFTFSVPKSVSLLYAMSGDQDILAAFRDATDETMREMEAEMKTRVTESQVRILQLTENVHRADLADAEKWRACEELLKLNAGWTNKDLAQHLKLTEATICKYLSPSRCTDEVRAALEAGQLGITAAYEISRVAPDKQGEMLRLREAGASRDGLANHARKQRTPAKAQVRAKRIVCSLPAGIRVTVSGPSLSLDEFIEALGEAQKEARKGREQKLDVNTWQRVMRDKSRTGRDT